MARNTAGKKPSKAAAYRDSEKALGATAELGAVRDFLMKNYGIDMKKTQISQYRANEKKRKGQRPGKRGPKPKAAIVTPTLSATKAPRDGDLIEFLGAVRGWENKIGAKKICDVIAALYQGR